MSLFLGGDLTFLSFYMRFFFLSFRFFQAFRVQILCFFPAPVVLHHFWLPHNAEVRTQSGSPPPNPGCCDTFLLSSDVTLQKKNISKNGMRSSQKLEGKEQGILMRTSSKHLWWLDQRCGLQTSLENLFFSKRISTWIWKTHNMSETLPGLILQTRLLSLRCSWGVPQIEKTTPLFKPSADWI